jgi:hypothetical protein
MNNFGRVLFAFLFLISGIVLGQIKVFGVINDSISSPVPFATIGMFAVSDSAVIKGTISDENGKYSFENLNPGKYFLKCYVIGYYEKYSEVFTVDTTSHSELPLNITLSVGSHNLSDVSVYALKKTIEFKNGNIIVNVENSPLAKGNSAFDLLLKLPGISIVNNTIILQGKSGVILMIDGRAQTVSGVSLVNLLKSMSADLIKTVEILRNPPVKYDASGTSGMINIVSKKTGISGWTGSVFYSYSQGFYDQMNGGSEINYKSKKIVFFSNISGERGNYRRVEEFSKRFLNDTSSMYMIGTNVANSLISGLSYKVGVDWFISEMDVLGVKIDGSPGENNSKSNSVNSVSGDNLLGFSYLASVVDQKDLWNSRNLNLNFEHKLDTLGSSFSLAADLSNLKEKVQSENSNLFYDATNTQILSPNIYKSENKGVSDITSGRADLLSVIKKGQSIESGIKFSQTRTFNNYLFERDFAGNSVYALDTSLTNNFKYEETTYAAYINYKGSFKKLEMQLGARVEKTYLKSINTARNFSLDREYFNVFPNLLFSYKPNDKHDFQLALSRRIDRPSFGDLNPFKFYNDQYSLSEGNPFLLPDYANRVDFTYASKKGFSITFDYSYIENTILAFTAQNDSTKVTTQSIKNISYSDKLGCLLSYENSIMNWWDISLSATFSNMNYKGDINGIKFYKSGLNYYGFISNSFLIKGQTRLQLNGTYLGPNVFGIFRFKPRYMVSLGITSTLLKEKLELTLGVDDIFYSFIFKNEVDYDNQKWEFSLREDSRRFRISLNYKFGKINVQQRAAVSNEEEKERLNH